MINSRTTIWQPQTVLLQFRYAMMTAPIKKEIPVMDYKILFIAGNSNAQWGNILQKAIGQAGCVKLTTLRNFSSLIMKDSFHLIFIDAGEISSFPQLVKEVHQLQPEAKIIVATASPTWQRARDAMRAGAYDYIRKHQNINQLANYLSETIHQENK
ncbi:MAG: response regulator [Chloroflexi bacterium]|nr:MAG: response regulator [Chloroflexota bacterium]